MKQQRSDKLEALFEAGMDLSPDEQAAFLDRECAGDPELRVELEKLFTVARQLTPSHLHLPILATTPARPPGRPRPVPEDTPATSSIPPATPREPLEPGTRIHHYELIRELGRGGMGAVYLARDTKLGRRVALKLTQSDRPTFTERFIAEARNTARCNHENIVVIHDVSEYGGDPFMVLEYLKGQTLQRLMVKGPVSASRAAQLMVPVLRALACAHDHQIIHRDLKPDNIFVTDSGTVKVLDFGISKLIHESQPKPAVDAVTTTDENVPPSPDLTRHGAIIGTLPYLSPEQWNAEELDFRSDLWAVGIILFQLVVGKHPLAPLSDEQLVLTALLEQPMPSAHTASVAMPPALADIIDGCLQKYRDRRISSASEVLAGLERLLPGGEGRALKDSESPYAGLTAFQEVDANRFFGRSRDIATVIARLPDQPLIGVVGPSGVGKSSFVRAGVIPALKHSGDEWESLVIRPGRQPVAALARLLEAVLDELPGETAVDGAAATEHRNRRHDLVRRLGNEPGYLGACLRDRARKHDRRIAVFVDQFEELYTLTPDVDERLTFTQALMSVADDPSSPLRLILSIRSDFLDRVAEDRRFMAELDKALYFLVQPDRDGLREAIVNPAELVGYRFQSLSIVDQMLDQLEATTGALPLLQFAATKLWDERDVVQKRLTERAYRDLGGVEGALASHANAILGNLTPQEQTLVRAIFLQLVTPERTRAITPVSELRELWHEPEVVQRLIDNLVDARLLVTQAGEGETGSLVEIVHESLIRSWPMLSHWLDQHAEDAPYLEQLKTAARQWDRKGRPSGLLWRGDEAAEAEIWYHRYRGLLPRVQAEYLDAVLALAAQGKRRKRLLVAGTIAVLSLLVVAAGIGLVVVNRAKEEARDSERKARAAEKLAVDKEHTIRRQYEELQAEKDAKRQAENKADTFRRRADEATSQVELSKEELQGMNHELQGMNRELTIALELARKKTDEARHARDELEVQYKLEQERLEQEKARVKELEQQLGAKRSTTLK
jgi:eukaryotic-like serine/threonine-protein kinase